MSQHDTLKPGQIPERETGAPVERRGALDTRRDFFGRAFAATSGIIFGGILCPTSADAQTAGACQATPGDELLDMLNLALKSSGGKLRCMVRMSNEWRAIPIAKTPGACNRLMLRFFEGWDAAGKKIWPPGNRTGLPTPGPTIDVRLGDQVELSFLNNVNPADFPGTIDTGRLPNEHPSAGCDSATLVGAPGTPSNPNWLPAADTYPNCFHGSNACNLHFHGTHVTPAGFGDNVLIMVQPAAIEPYDPEYTTPFAEIYANCGKYEQGPVDWKTAVPPGWQQTQDRLLKQYDASTQFRGRRGLPKEVSLYEQNQKALAAHEWPPYQMGAFPNCLRITPEPRPEGPYLMGQAPGTHWYHAHKHGSTTMHILHGLAGAMIIRGPYDDDLTKYYPSLRERVLIIQEYNDLPPLYGSGSNKAVLLNGQFQPAITMKEGEIQLFRIVNAAQQGQMPFTGLPADSFRQIAQDGVQFKAENYERQPLTTKISMFPGNRMDLLVKAPPKGATYQLKVNTNTILATVKSVPSSDPPMDFPPTKGYPIRFPDFLTDIPESEIRKSRRLTFGWDTSKGGNPKAQPPGTQRNPQTNAPPHFTIDGKQFDHAVIDQTMELNDCEEWKIENTTTIPHPFHIHVNPFQVVEVFDPGTSSEPVILPAPYVWWDVFAIPPGGYFKMRSRFADFTGKFVIHCHILGHEDRGMMQVVEVIPQRKLNVPHH